MFQRLKWNVTKFVVSETMEGVEAITEIILQPNRR